MNVVEVLPGSSSSNPCPTALQRLGLASLLHDVAAASPWVGRQRFRDHARAPRLQHCGPRRPGALNRAVASFFPTPIATASHFGPFATTLLFAFTGFFLSGFTTPYFSLPKEVAEIKTDLEVAKQGLSNQVKALDVKVNALDINVGKDLKALDAKVDTIRKDLSDLKERVSMVSWPWWQSSLGHGHSVNMQQLQHDGALSISAIA
ncbi:hypothetical protein V8C86DRAFT_2437371 [Haematococcus lacustris]